ncbi:hypothetical protein ScPMuIL_016002 [Solemya velum]
MTDQVFKAPRTKRTHNRHNSEFHGNSPPKRKKTKEDFFTFCSMILEYTQYDALRQEEIRATNNVSPLDSSGSTADSYVSDTTLSTISSSSREENSGSIDLIESDDESWELITCHCLKPYAGRPMIECSHCNTWIHLSCAKIRKTNIPETFVCQHCRDSSFSTRKSNRVRVEKRLTI